MAFPSPFPTPSGKYLSDSLRPKDIVSTSRTGHINPASLAQLLELLDVGPSLPSARGCWPRLSRSRSYLVFQISGIAFTIGLSGGPNTSSMVGRGVLIVILVG